MTREDAKKWVPILQAYSEGKMIEVKQDNGPCLSSSYWTFDNDVDNYRIKPEPTLRPWRPEEVPILAEFKNSSSWRRVPVLINDEGVFFVYNRQIMCYTFSEICNEYKHSLDYGKTWLPCGIYE